METAPYRQEPSLAEAVKAGQRNSALWKEAWKHWCEMQGQNTYDPTRHDAQGIREFMNSMASAYLGEQHKDFMPHLSPIREMVEFVKAGQKSQVEFREAWSAHCDEYGNGTKDPTNHVGAFFVSFAFRYGVGLIGSADWAQPYLESLTIIAMPLLIDAIKAGQRNDLEWKESWTNFCDNKTVAPGTYDPARQDGGTLLQFMETVGLPKFGDKPWCKVFICGVFEETR